MQSIEIGSRAIGFEDCICIRMKANRKRPMPRKSLSA